MDGTAFRSCAGHSPRRRQHVNLNHKDYVVSEDLSRCAGKCQQRALDGQVNSPSLLDGHFPLTRHIGIYAFPDVPTAWPQAGLCLETG